MVSISYNKGYTLIEVILVMLIISIASSVAVLSLNRNQNTQFKNTSLSIVNVLKLAQDQSQLEPTTIKLEVEKHGLTFYRYQYEPTSRKYYWQAMTEKVFRGLANIPDVFFQLRGPSAILLYASGEVTPFTLQLKNKKHQTLYQVSGIDNGEILQEKIA